MGKHTGKTAGKRVAPVLMTGDLTVPEQSIRRSLSVLPLREPCIVHLAPLLRDTGPTWPQVSRRTRDRPDVGPELLLREKLLQAFDSLMRQMIFH
jgi:hypothetical protein